MALTVLQRPEGHILSGTEITATVSEDYDGDALFTKTTHGLTTGDYVYIKGTIESYNGFWYVRVIDADKFNIRPNAIEENVDWIQNATVTYQESVSEHKWSCVHLPIVYRIRTNRWPTNEVNSIVGIASYANDEGYVRITTSSVYFVGWSELLYVKISGAADDRVNGIWQILELGTPPTTITTLALAYDPHYDFSGATLQVYFTSYAIRVNIYAGLDGNHYWAGQKPFELIDTIDLTPDPENEVMFSISEKVLKHMQTRNNLTLSTLPNNLDFWTQFYITFQEIYDDSDGYTLFTAEDILNNDNAFKGYAVNAMLAFKNIHSGFLSEYVMKPGVFGKFLTLFSIPVFFATGCSDGACFYDVSFISDNQSGQLILRQDYYIGDVLQSTVDKDIESFSEGLYRVRLDQPSCDYESIKIAVYKLLELPSFLFWTTRAGDPAWTISETPTITLTTDSSILEYNDLSGFTPGLYFFPYSVTITGAGIGALNFSFLKDGVFVGSASSGNLTGPDTFTGTFVINLTDTPDQVTFQASAFPVNPKTFTINSLTMDTYGGDQYTRISEEKTIAINCDCDDEIVQEGEIRLTEDGNFRILE